MGCHGSCRLRHDGVHRAHCAVRFIICCVYCKRQKHMSQSGSMSGGVSVDARALRGVNLAGWLTLESWVTPEPFANSGALDEITLSHVLGAARYRAIVGAHRASFVNEHDFTLIASRGFNAIRLPVPWYVLGSDGPDPKDFVGCLTHVDHAFDWAEDLGLRLVLAVAVSPGRTPSGAHASQNLWGSITDLLEVINVLAGRYARRMGFYGIELADSPQIRRRRGLGFTEGISINELREYYQQAYSIVRAVAGEDVTVILPNAGITGSWRPFTSEERYSNLWLSCQLLHNADRASGQGRSGVRRLVDASRNELNELAKCNLPVAVSAWSGALPYADTLMTPEGRIALERVYLSEQLAAFRSCPAWFFQTWKTSGRLQGWDARVSLATFERRMLA